MPRGRGRGRPKGRGRGRAVTSTVAVTPVADGRAERRAAFEARKAGLLEKVLELAELEDAAVAVVCSGVDGLGGADYWPSVEAARAVAELFRELPEEVRSTGGHASYVEGQRDAQRPRLVEVREGGIAAALGPWERDLGRKTVEALQELLASIEVSRKAARSRIRELQPQPEESVAENLGPGGEDASGEVQSTQKQPQGADGVQGTQKQPQGADEVQGTQKQRQGQGAAADDDAAWMEQLVEDLMEKPESASGSAGPYDADEVQGTQKQPQGQGADEVQGAQNQTPGDDDDDDAAWMEQLVEDLKEKPESASGGAAPYDAGMIEYMNVGGYVMESDTYDFIRFDLGMFPPSLQPESPDYDEPLRLWSWDDSSFPQDAPPPPPK